MTILQALQSLAEYDNTNLLSKVLADIGLTGSDDYVSATHKAKVDLACADMYDHLSVHPEFREGKFAIKFSASALRSMATKLRKKHGIRTPSITGTSKW